MLENKIQPIIDDEIPACERDHLMEQQDGAQQQKVDNIARLLYILTNGQ